MNNTSNTIRFGVFVPQGWKMDLADAEQATARLRGQRSFEEYRKGTALGHPTRWRRGSSMRSRQASTTLLSIFRVLRTSLSNCNASRTRSCHASSETTRRSLICSDRPVMLGHALA